MVINLNRQDVKLDEKSLLFWQVNRINSIMSDKKQQLGEDELISYKNTLREAVDNFEIMLEVKTDDKYDKTKEQLRDELKDNLKEVLEEVNRENSTAHKKKKAWERIKYNKKRFKELMKLLSRNNIYFEDKTVKTLTSPTDITSPKDIEDYLNQEGEEAKKKV